MKINYDMGDFNRFGVSVSDSVTFTFASPGNQVYLCLYHIKSKKLIEKIHLSEKYRIGNVFSVCVESLDILSVCYNYEVDGEIVNDPYSYKLTDANLWNNNNKRIYSMICDFPKPSKYEALPINELIIYRLHMRGLTMGMGNSKNNGTYSALIGYISKLKELNINTVLLMPIYDFNENHNKKIDYWGYGDTNPYYLAPKESYFGEGFSEKNAQSMIDVFHKAGINVLMEICYSKSVDLGEDMIIRASRHWALNYGVDGFRYIGDNLPVSRLINDPYLSDKYMFFEDTYDLGDKTRVFYYNDSYLYSLRKLQNHSEGSVKDICEILCRGGDVGFANYVASSNGFTLNDVYSYSDKHNEDNLEDNTDGCNYSCSYNYGVEGPTRDKSILDKRLKSIRSALCLLAVSKGVPVLEAGDEMLNSANGNNNPYCQDNKIGWVNHSKAQNARNLSEYVSKLFEFRVNHPVLYSYEPLQMSDYKRTGMPDLSYHKNEPWALEIGNGDKSMGILLNGAYSKDKSDEDIMILFNFYTNEEKYSLPTIPGKKWYLITNTKSFDFNMSGELIKDTDNVSVCPGTVSVLVAK